MYPLRTASIRDNQLLNALPEADQNRIQHFFQLTQLTQGTVLSEPGTTQSFVYFPISAIISLLYVLEDGSSTEMAVIGREGCVGTPVFMGGRSSLNQVMVHTAGYAYKLRAMDLQEEFSKGGVTSSVLLRFTQALMTQMAQLAVCNRHHQLDQQICRWLLQALDRMDGDEILMTHELISQMLGVRREAISHAANRMQKEGLISYTRGRIKVTDRHGLLSKTCECYGVLQREYARLLPPTKLPVPTTTLAQQYRKYYDCTHM